MKEKTSTQRRRDSERAEEKWALLPAPPVSVSLRLWVEKN
jgi:hypothetical protein